MCGHPELRPTNWNQPKSPPAEMTGRCEHNQTCPVCGFGWGSWPCPCDVKAAEERKAHPPDPDEIMPCGHPYSAMVHDWDFYPGDQLEPGAVCTAYCGMCVPGTPSVQERGNNDT